ncbi:hypothetical protein AAFF_G00060210 [Aldrovandia affinis]|uniref:Uncharacterized protein n=1 Tax=Aldrovandia affinis TaxID=143900 RepID=A0AAD7S072_9TELE|nr:hypothetical protein AAFF_G00060210 [Aldrovandia affinis]
MAVIDDHWAVNLPVSQEWNALMSSIDPLGGGLRSCESERRGAQPRCLDGFHGFHSSGLSRHPLSSPTAEHQAAISHQNLELVQLAPLCNIRRGMMKRQLSALAQVTMVTFIFRY